jgi:hypothetical protein
MATAMVTTRPQQNGQIMGTNDKARGWSKAEWDAWYASQRKTETSKASEEYWETPPTLTDAIEVTAGSRLTANQLAAKIHREQPHLSFQECVARTFELNPALYSSETAASELASKANADGTPLHL